MRKKIGIAILSMFVFALVASVALANYGDDNSLSGKVKEYKVLKAINKAKVKLYRKSGSLKDKDTTDKKGRYEFDDLSEATYKVKAKADGYRNPVDANKDTVSKTVKVDGSDTKNLYLQKI